MMMNKTVEALRNGKVRDNIIFWLDSFSESWNQSEERSKKTTL